MRLVKEGQKAGDRHIYFVRGEQLSSGKSQQLESYDRSCEDISDAMDAEVKKRDILDVIWADTNT